MTEQEILIQTLLGANTATIAADLGCTDRTVRRSLDRIRREAVALGELDDRPAGSRRPIPPEIRMATAENGLRPTHLESDITLLRLAGLGAFSKVYCAIDRISGETVAVKFLRKNGWRERRDVASLLGEYETLMSIHHPGVVGVHGMGKNPRWGDVPCPGMDRRARSQPLVG